MSLRNLQGISLDAIAPETRFDVAYKAIMQLAIAALHANGYRLLTSRPGHHQTAIQSLPLAIGLALDKMQVLDALRKQRNLADYSGERAPIALVDECMISARELHTHVQAWLVATKPELL